MLQQELIRRSPLRILENSTHGGVEKGNIGILAARKGVGKTAALVHIATDQLMQEKHIIHVSFSDTTDHIIAWYEDIFNELARRNNLDGAMEIHDAIIKNRVIMNFTQDGIHITEIEKSLRTLVDEGRFSADTVVIDGYDFSRSSAQELQKFKSFAQDLGLKIWFSATLQESPNYDPTKIPDSISHVVDEATIVICLKAEKDHIRLNLVKDHDTTPDPDLHLKLDPQILLIMEDR
ncbi:MAG: hypothetical protein ACOCW2_01940 [Chitinivibrionales bacterium]